jgi:nucleotide-binding universal stress UspA family protein
MTILFAVDLSEPADVTSSVEEIAFRQGADLCVLHVYQPSPASPMPVDPMTGFGDMAYAIYDPAVQASMEQAEQHEFDAFVRERFRRVVRPALLQGDPARTILQEAERLDADLIVVGKRQHGMLERFLLGSVSQAIVNQAHRPVLVVPVSGPRGD